MARPASIIQSALAGTSASAVQAVQNTVKGPKGPTRKAKSLDMLNRFIKPALSDLGVSNKSAEALLLGTAIVESGGFRFTRQQPSGPGRGLFQVELVTLQDIWAVYLPRQANNQYVQPIINMLSPAGQSEAINTPTQFAIRYSELETNVKYCCAMAYLKYEWFLPAWPSAKNVRGLANAWKTYYNTSRGAGSVTLFETEWNYMLNQGRPGFTLP